MIFCGFDYPRTLKPLMLAKWQSNEKLHQIKNQGKCTLEGRSYASGTILLHGMGVKVTGLWKGFWEEQKILGRARGLQS